MKEPWADVWKRVQHTPSPDVRRRIERLNPEGHEAGCRPRGWHPAKRLANDWSRNLVGPKQFIAMLGREAYRLASTNGWFFHEGHRKAMTAENVEDNLWKRPRNPEIIHPLDNRRIFNVY